MNTVSPAKPSTRGEGKEEAALPPKREANPGSLRPLPLPKEEARVDTPSFLWKEVPRRGGGWMGIAVSPTQSLPRVGKGASGASRIGFWRYEKERRRSSQVRRLREHPSVAKKEANSASLRSAAPSIGRGSRGHSLHPMEGGALKGRRLDGDSGILDTKPSPRGEGGERSEPDRVLAV